MDAEALECCFCGRPVHAGQSADHLPIGSLVIHTECLEHREPSDNAGNDGLARAA